MTSHRRRRKIEIMPHLSKDRKRDAHHGKEKSDGSGKPKVPLPLSQKSVYIDVKGGKHASVLEDQLKKLGAAVEKFLSREVNYVISSSAPPTKSEERYSNEDNPQSPSFGNVPSPFSSIPSPTAPTDPKASMVPRGKVLAQIACARSRGSTVVANAEKWGIKVVSLEAASKWLDKELKKLEKENGKDSNAKMVVDQKQRKKVVNRKKKVFKGTYIKFEAINRMYRPVKTELEKWPRLNLLAPPGLNSYCEVKMKIQDIRRRQSSCRIGKILLSTSGKGNLKRSCSMSSMKESVSGITTTLQGTPEVVAVPITTAGDVKRHLEIPQRKRPDKLQGYCESCRMKYKDMNKHVKEEEHQTFARDKNNYESLDALIKQVPSTYQFLQDILLKHCAQKQTDTLPANERISSPKVPERGIDVQAVISPLPSELTPPPNPDGIRPCHRTPHMSQPEAQCVEKHREDPEDSRPHAVVIRRPFPSGAFVSPRRREPTPSKKPWMQERSMVFRDSPMASLQPSNVFSSIKFVVSESLLANPFQHESKEVSRHDSSCERKSVVRSLLHTRDFEGSDVSTCDEELSEMNNGWVISKSANVTAEDTAQIDLIEKSNDHLVELNPLAKEELTEKQEIDCFEHPGVFEKKEELHCVEKHIEQLTPDNKIGDATSKSKDKIKSDVKIRERPVFHCEKSQRNELWGKDEPKDNETELTRNTPICKDIEDNEENLKTRGVERNVRDYEKSSAVGQFLEKKPKRKTNEGVINKEISEVESVGEDKGPESVIKSPDFFVPCIADRVKRRSRVSEICPLIKADRNMEQFSTSINSPLSILIPEMEIENKCDDSVVDPVSEVKSNKEPSSYKTDVLHNSLCNMKAHGQEINQEVDLKRKGAASECEAGVNIEISDSNQRQTSFKPTDKTEIEHKRGRPKKKKKKGLNIDLPPQNVNSNEDVGMDLKHSKSLNAHVPGNDEASQAGTDSWVVKGSCESGCINNTIAADNTDKHEEKDESYNCLLLSETLKERMCEELVAISWHKRKELNKKKSSSTTCGREGSVETKIKDTDDFEMADERVIDSCKSDMKKRRKSSSVNCGQEESVETKIENINDVKTSDERVKDSCKSEMKKRRKSSSISCGREESEETKVKNIDDIKMVDERVIDAYKSDMKKRRKSSSISCGREGSVETKTENIDDVKEADERVIDTCKSDMPLEEEKQVDINGCRKSKTRLCKLFVHEGIYADIGKGNSLSHIDSSIPKEHNKASSVEEAVVETCGSVYNASWKEENSENNVEMDKQNDGEEKYENERQWNNLTQSGKRVFKGKKFHSTKANWDVKAEDLESVENSVEELTSALNVVDLVKRRRLCTEFNHEGQYANDGEGMHSKSDENNFEVSIRKQNQLANESEKSVLAIVVRRAAFTGPSMEKRDASWCKVMSKKDWSLCESECKPSNDQAQESESIDSKVHQDQLCDGERGRLEQEFGAAAIEKSPAGTKMTVTQSSVYKMKQGTKESSKKAGNGKGSRNRCDGGETSSSRKVKDGSHLGASTCKGKEKYSENSRTSWINSPRLRMKLKKNQDNDCYSSTLEMEDYSETNLMTSKTEIFNVEDVETFSSPRRISKAKTSPVGQWDSDSIDLLDTPRRGRQTSGHVSRDVPVRRFNLSPIQSGRGSAVEDDNGSKDLKDPERSVTSIPPRKKRRYSECNEMGRPPSLEKESSSLPKNPHIQSTLDKTQKSSDQNDFKNELVKRRKVESQEIGSCFTNESAQVSHFKCDNNCKVTLPVKPKHSKNYFHPSKIKSTEFSKSPSFSYRYKRQAKDTRYDDYSTPTKGNIEITDDETIQTDDKEHHAAQRTKSMKRKGKRKLCLSGQATSDQSKKKIRLAEQSMEDSMPVKDPGNDDSSPITMNFKLAFASSKDSVVDKDAAVSNSNQKLHPEVSGNNLGDLLNYIPHFSSPGKTNSSWGDACDSYLNSSVKHVDQTPGRLDSITPKCGSLWSPAKQSSPRKSLLKSPLLKSDLNQKGSQYYNRSNKSDFNSDSAQQYSTPTKRNRILPSFVEGSPSVEKIDSDVYFNHMSPQRINFSPVKVRTPLRNSEKSPMVQKIDSVISFNHMSPQRLQFSPVKLDIQGEKPVKGSSKRRL